MSLKRSLALVPAKQVPWREQIATSLPTLAIQMEMGFRMDGKYLVGIISAKREHHGKSASHSSKLGLIPRHKDIFIEVDFRRLNFLENRTMYRPFAAEAARDLASDLWRCGNDRPSH